MTVELVSTFSGAYCLDKGRVVTRFDAPHDETALVERLRRRRDGERTPEEEQLLAATEGLDRLTHDRRLAIEGVRLDPRPGSDLPADLVEFPDPWRDILLQDAQESLTKAWDPSVHIDEAVRSLGDLDEMLNLLGERLESWNNRAAVGNPNVPESESGLAPLRDKLGELRSATQRMRTELEHAIEQDTPSLAPNLCALLGPLLAARLLSRAGGLARLARLPASTVQVLGAERAFFDHLRGHAPPPRHGLLFLHPDIQSAPRAVRGRVARALAGKAAIAARLDYAKRPVDPRLVRAFQARSERARAPRKGGRR